ncbi:outer membrane autotransporter barrel domain protein, partial [Chlamydia psittaci 03DC29]
ILASTLDF